MDLKTQVGDMEESLLDHLLQESEKLCLVNEQQSHEFRREQELRRKAEKERTEFRVEYLNFKLRLTMEHADLQELKQTLEELTSTWENEKQTRQSKRRSWSKASLPVVTPPANPKKALLKCLY